MSVSILTLIILMGLGVVGVSLFVIGIRMLLRKKIFVGGGICASGGVFILIVLLFCLFILNFYAYQKLTREQEIAKVDIKRIEKQSYRINIERIDQSQQFYQLYGDEWQIDARVIKWRNLATLIGAAPLFRLERISGRYVNTEKQRRGPLSVYSLVGDVNIDLWNLLQQNQQWIPWVDTMYGSSAYMPMVDGANYRVSMTLSGLIIKPTNETAKKAVKRWR